MIRLLVRFSKWLEARFPEKLVVNAAEYQSLRAEVDILRGDLNELKANHAATLDRMGRLEYSAAHVDAVKELVKHVGEVKTELVSLKANLGWSNRGTKGEEINAILNGEPI